MHTDGAGELRVSAVNLQWGGIDADGSTDRQDQALRAMEEDSPQVVLLSEVTGLPPASIENPPWDMQLADRDKIIAGGAARAHDAARRCLHRIACRLGMTPVLGPPAPGTATGLHTAILIRTGDGIEISGTGPAPQAPGSADPAWTQASVRISGVPHPVVFYSVHLPARSALRQLWQAESLASAIAQRGQHAHAGGDWNTIPRSDHATERDLMLMPPHLRPARMVLEDGKLRPDYRVDDAMTVTGLADVAADLPTDRRVPADLMATGNAGSRTDRHYATAALSGAAIGYRQAAIAGSDHHMTTVTYDRAVLAAAVPAGPRD